MWWVVVCLVIMCFTYALWVFVICVLSGVGVMVFEGLLHLQGLRVAGLGLGV